MCTCDSDVQQLQRTLADLEMDVFALRRDLNELKDALEEERQRRRVLSSRVDLQAYG